jgi:hypothetical protein
MFQGIPVDVTDPARVYRGFIALDMIQQSSGSYCRGFCSFAAGFCDWGNEQGDDFDWALVSLLLCFFLRDRCFVWFCQESETISFIISVTFHFIR